MAPSEMASMSPPPAYSPGAREDTEVLSQRIAPKGGAQDAVREAPQGETSTAGHMREPIPMDTGEEGRIQFGPQPNTIPETHMAPESGEQPPLKKGGCAASTGGPRPSRGTGYPDGGATRRLRYGRASCPYGHGD